MSCKCFSHHHLKKDFLRFSIVSIILTSLRQEAGGRREMIRTDREDWKRWSASYNMLPYICEMDWPAGLPASWEPFWDCASPYSFVLESGRSGKYTFMGLHPQSIISGTGDDAIERQRVTPDDIEEILRLFDTDVDQKDGDSSSRRRSQGRPSHHRYEATQRWEGSPLHVLRRWMSKYQVPKDMGAPPFTGGCVGYIGYDVARSLERLPVIADPVGETPDYVFMMFDRVWVYDHEREKLIVCIYTYISREMTNERIEESTLLALYDKAEQAATQMISLWTKCAKAGEHVGTARREAYERAAGADQLAIDLEHASDLQVSMSKERFTSAVERIQEYIRAGDVFQVNLSVRQERELKVAPEIVYEWLRWLNPSPYMGLLRLDDHELVSASPELLLKKEGRKLRTRPIAGTRRRGHTKEEDQALERELLESEKERAEHVMLVDLERNDIGKVAEYGTVQVDQLMVIERYSHVMHLVSDISGELPEGRDEYDALAAVFPGGTITGAPKIRTMEIIEELEPVRRGIYTGSFGWIDYNGDMEFNIIIRTLLAKDGRACVQAGAGIVIDSIPVREYRESLSKAKALWKAVQYAEQAEASGAFEHPKHPKQPIEGGAS